MAGKLHHAAINSAKFEDTVRFFEEVFQMEVSRTTGEAPERKLWFHQGIQVNEARSAESGAGQYDHIGIQVTDKAQTLEKAAAFGCTPVPGKPHWFTMPEGVVLELMD